MVSLLARGWCLDRKNRLVSSLTTGFADFIQARALAICNLPAPLCCFLIRASRLQQVQQQGRKRSRDWRDVDGGSFRSTDSDSIDRRRRPALTGLTLGLIELELANS
jgi:hypothetical protein